MKDYSLVIKQLNPMEQNQLFSLPQDSQMQVLDQMFEAYRLDRANQALNNFMARTQKSSALGVDPSSIEV